MFPEVMPAGETPAAASVCLTVLTAPLLAIMAVAGEAGHAFVQHFGVHTIVEDVFGLVERFFPDRGHFGNGVAIFRADFGNAVMAKLILPVGEPDPYVRVASAMRQEGAQRLAYPVGEARCSQSMVSGMLKL